MAWVLVLFHSSFKEELLDERDLKKFAKNSKTKTIKENARSKDNSRNYSNTLRR